MNVIDYVKEYGAYTFEERAFCEVDSLCLSLLSYLPLSAYVQEGFESEYTLQSLCGLYLVYQEECEAAYNRRFALGNTAFFKAMARSTRFSSLRITGFADRHDEERQMQFAALTVLAPDFHFISFRGTDDTLVGWKEDFNMSFLCATPSQLAAAKYLESAANILPAKPIYVGGHSKGGNLAVFAAASVSREVQLHLGGIFAHDAPGFLSEFLTGEGYLTVHAICHGFIPQTSVIGMLLGDFGKSTVVHSDTLGLLQHDPYSWQVEGGAFVREDATDAHSRYVDKTLCTWLAGMDLSAREQFVDAVYELLSSTEASSVGELTRQMARSLSRVYRRYKDMDDKTRSVLREMTERLFSAAWKSLNVESALQEKRADLRRRISEAYEPIRDKLSLLSSVSELDYPKDEEE
ncbi:MAG: DUF2974 domain-containing protein [Clostridia bacterium]|nr:DUF2974 domain-containing protein [Clostridia bacterium]